MGVTPDLTVEIASRYAVYLEGVKEGNVRKFDKFIREMQADILRQIRAIDDPASLTKKRLNEILRAVNEAVQTGAANYEKIWRAQALELGEYAAQFEIKAMGRVVRADFLLPTPNQLAAAAFATPLGAEGIYEGMLLDAFFKDVSSKTKTRVAGAVRLVAAQGGTTQDLVRRIRGTRASKFKDGLMELARRDVNALARTSLAHVSSTSRMAVWKANPDIVEQVELLAVLDSRTTEPCRSLSGQRFDIDKAPQPPLHINCRSGLMPVFNDGLDFLDKAGSQFSRGPDGIKRVSPDMTYYQYLKTQSPAFQDSVIGPSRGALLRDGGLSTDDFARLQLNKNFRPITLADMQKLEPLAFESAGL